MDTEKIKVGARRRSRREASDLRLASSILWKRASLAAKAGAMTYTTDDFSECYKISI